MHNKDTKFDWSKPVHILNGDALKDNFPLVDDSQIIIMRECLVLGPLQAPTLGDFYHQRAEFLEPHILLPESFYFSKVVQELSRLRHLADQTTVYLWFEDDLFCQLNMWFIVYLLKHYGFTGRLLRIFPFGDSVENNWQGFGWLSKEENLACSQQPVTVTPDEQALIRQLWNAVQTKGDELLSTLKHRKSASVRHLPLIIDAYLNRHSRPKNRILEILSQGTTDFTGIFQAFQRTEGIYGYGDVQVRALLDDLQQKNI